MYGTEKLDELKFNEIIETKKIIPGMEVLMGENMKYVGKKYLFVGDTGLLQELNLYAKGFDPHDYEQE